MVDIDSKHIVSPRRQNEQAKQQVLGTVRILPPVYTLLGRIGGEHETNDSLNRVFGVAIDLSCLEDPECDVADLTYQAYKLHALF